MHQSPSVSFQHFEQEAIPHLSEIEALALALTRNDDEAADLVQNTCVRALDYWHTYEPGTNCRAWLLRICRSQFIRQWRRDQAKPDRRIRDFTHEVDAAHQSAFGAGPFREPWTELVMTLLTEDLEAALTGLPECYERPLRLRVLKGLPYHEIASALGVPLGTVKSRIARGRTLLRNRMALT